MTDNSPHGGRTVGVFELGSRELSAVVKWARGGLTDHGFLLEIVSCGSPPEEARELLRILQRELGVIHVP